MSTSVTYWDPGSRGCPKLFYWGSVRLAYTLVTSFSRQRQKFSRMTYKGSLFSLVAWVTVKRLSRKVYVRGLKIRSGPTSKDLTLVT